MTEAESIAIDRLILRAEIEYENENAALAADSIIERIRERSSVPVVRLRDRDITQEQLMKPTRITRWWFAMAPEWRFVTGAVAALILFCVAFILAAHYTL